MEDNLLKDIKIFSPMTEKEAEIIIKASRAVRVAKHRSIFMQGDPSHSVYFLREGRVKISKINLDGRKLTIDLIEPGDIFGELSLSDEKVRRNIAEAVEDSFCWEIKTEALETCLRKRPDIAVKLMKMIGDKRLAMENLLEDMIFMDIPSRVASLLLKYSDREMIKIPFTHQEIADLTGSTRVSVSRAIAKLRKNGVIKTKGDRIRLLNPAALYQLVQYSSRFIH